jgi:pyruvate/2-oxoglutarate dehydrogenase complex dihydrolipoamide acyltransferase (E2) component
VRAPFLLGSASLDLTYRGLWREHGSDNRSKVPDIGDFKDVPVIEIMVKPGDTVKAEDPLVSRESDKATMEWPAPLGGVVQELKIKLGDKISEGTVILTLTTGSAAAQPTAASSARVHSSITASRSKERISRRLDRTSGLRDPYSAVIAISIEG